MRILHLSDLHYGYLKAEATNNAKSAHYLVDGDGKPDPAALADVLAHSQQCEDIAVLVVTGDIGWSGGKPDYEFALEFLNHIRSKWPDIRFVIAPGNHDVDLQESVEAEKRQDQFLSFVREFFGESFNNTYPFITEKVSRGFRHRIISITRYEDEAIFVAINSAASINNINDPVLINPDVLRRIDRELGRLPARTNPIRVLVLHHHVLPFVEPPWGSTINVDEVREKPDNSIVANSAKLQAWLNRHQFQLVLHGHKHLFHGREDILWRAHPDGVGRKIVIVGAGSAGVHWDEIGREQSHSLNVIDIERQDDERWRLDVCTGNITDRNGVSAIADWFSYKTSVGDLAAMSTPFFRSRYMDLCHKTIKSELEKAGPVRNFMSVVDTATYIHSNSIQINGTPEDQSNVENSFIALHPEYDKRSGWRNTKKIDDILHRINDTYRIQHGPRLFSKIAQFGPGARLTNTESFRPIQSALEKLETHGSRAYVSLYDPERDVGPNAELLPGLVGIQFIARASNEQLLDIAFFFRSLELSFWWAVNMLEAIRLLEWACKKVSRDTYKPEPGSITFFSATAEWRDKPRPMFVSSIDDMDKEELFALIIAVNSGSKGSVEVLVDKLKEKIDHTSDINIDCTGLENVLSLVKAILLQRDKSKDETIAGPISHAFTAHIQSAVQQLHTAIDDRKECTDSVENAQNSLTDAVQILESWLKLNRK